MNSESEGRQGSSIMDSESADRQGSTLVRSWNQCFPQRSGLFMIRFFTFLINTYKMISTLRGAFLCPFHDVLKNFGFRSLAHHVGNYISSFYKTWGAR